MFHEGGHWSIFGEPGGGESKKLEDAVRYWAAGGSEKDETRNDAAIMGVSIPVIVEAPRDCVVWEENWETVMMFLRMQTQWNVVMGGYTGLKYEVLEWLCRLYSVGDARAMLEGIQIMESFALQELNKNGK